MVDPNPALPITTSATAPPTHAVCPYLLAPAGRWRSASPAREHRCTAVVPGAILAPEKQRRLCLVSEHLGCATYLVATDRPSAAPRAGGAREGRPAARNLVRTTPLVLDHGRLPVSVQSLARDRGLGQGALLMLMAVAFAAILFARLSSDGSGDSGGVLAGLGTPAPSATTRTATATPAPTDTASPARTLVPTAVEPTATPTATPAPAATAAPTVTASPTTYKVLRGDTLSGIAAEFGTTVKALSELNGIDDPSRLRVGQVLKLP